MGVRLCHDSLREHVKDFNTGECEHFEIITLYVRFKVFLKSQRTSRFVARPNYLECEYIIRKYTNTTVFICEYKQH